MTQRLLDDVAAATAAHAPIEHALIEQALIEQALIEQAQLENALVKHAQSRLLALAAEVEANADVYAADASRWPRTRSRVMWMTGLAGSGKTFWATRLAEQLRTRGEHALLLDGDGVRLALDSVEQRGQHDDSSRWRRGWRMVHLAHRAALIGEPVIVATISLKHAIQAANRACHTRFAEVQLDASIQQLTARRPDLYANPSVTAELIGLGQAAEWPLRPDLVLRSSAEVGNSHDPLEADDALEQVMHVWQAL